MTLTFNVYNTLAQKLEQDKLRIQEQTPVYTIIEPATVPLKASSPKKLLILVAFIFLAFIGGCGYLIIKEYASPRRRDLKRNPKIAIQNPDCDFQITIYSPAIPYPTSSFRQNGHCHSADLP